MAKKKPIEGLRRSPRLVNKQTENGFSFPKAAEVITKRKMMENGSKTIRLERLAREFVRRSPRLRNVSCEVNREGDLKKDLGFELGMKEEWKKNVVEKLRGNCSGEEDLESRIVKASDKVEVLLDESELFQEAIRVLSKGLADRRRTKRKRREIGFDKLVISLKNNEIVNKEEISEPQKDSSELKFQEEPKSIVVPKQFINYYKRKPRNQETVSKAINPTDSHSNLDLNPPNIDSNSRIQETSPSNSKLINTSKTDININSEMHSKETENLISTCIFGPDPIIPYTPSPSKSNTKSDQLSESNLFTDSAKSAFNEPSSTGKSIEFKTDSITNPVINNNLGSGLMVHGGPGLCNKGFIVRKARSPRFLHFKIRDKECNEQFNIGNNLNLNQSGFVKSRFENRVNKNSTNEKSRYSDEKIGKMRGTFLKKRGRDTSLHKLVFEEGGIADGTLLTYCINNKVLLTGYKQGDCIVCACHEIGMRPSQFEAHAGMAQRRKPYHHIYTSDGKTLHDLCLELAKNQEPISEFQVKFKSPHHDYSRKTGIIPTKNKLIRELKTLNEIIISCSICKDSSAALGDKSHSKLIIFCNQCGKAYHVGCLDNKESFNIEDVYNKNWFCCTDCTWIYTKLKNLCINDPNQVPCSFLEFLKGQKTEENSLDIEWQIFSEKNNTEEMLLIQALQIFKSAFKPINEERHLIRSMVFGIEMIGKGLDFNGMFCIAIKVNKEIVCIALLRVFGKFVAEMPLVTTIKASRRKGYTRMLLSLIEELLGLLEVRLLIAPVHDKMQSIWINKFGFVKSTDQKVQVLREQHAIMEFENTDILEKTIPVEA